MSTFTRALHAAGDALSTAGNWCRPEIITKNAGNPQTVVQGETRRALALRRIRAEGHPKKRADDDNAAQTEKESAQIVSSLAIVISVIIEFVKVNLKMLHNCFVCGSACIGCWEACRAVNSDLYFLDVRFTLVVYVRSVNLIVFDPGNVRVQVRQDVALKPHRFTLDHGAVLKAPDERFLVTCYDHLRL